MPHSCNDTFLVKNPDGAFRCQKLDNVRVSNENTKHQCMPLPNDYSFASLKIIQRIGLTEKLHIDDDGNVLEFKSYIPFFHPYRNVPPTNTTNYINISIVEGYTFVVCKSMHNFQILTVTGGCSK